VTVSAIQPLIISRGPAKSNAIRRQNFGAQQLLEQRSSLIYEYGLARHRCRRRLKARGRSRGLPTVLMGYAIECLVEAYALIGSGGRLTTARPDSDVDHRDFIVE
jgi:hypothetical protein